MESISKPNKTIGPLFFPYCFELLQRVDPERTLTDPQRDEFEDMLRALTLERSQIKDAMGFALDNADAAGEVLLHISAFNLFSF